MPKCKNKYNKLIGNDTKAAARQSPNCIRKTTKEIKYDEKRLSIWRIELLHPAMWHDHALILPGDCTLQCGMWLWNHDSEFIKWQHPAMWHVALGSWHWIRQVAAPCNVAGGSGMTCHVIRPNVGHVGILHLVSILTISPQSTCHSAPVCEILSNRTTLNKNKWRHVEF